MSANALVEAVRVFLEAAHVSNSYDLSRRYKSEKPMYHKLVAPAHLDKLRSALRAYEEGRTE